MESSCPEDAESIPVSLVVIEAVSKSGLFREEARCDELNDWLMEFYRSL
jgi:hypothetical protein